MFGPRSARLHIQPESQAPQIGQNAERNRSGHPAPFWTVFHGQMERPREMDSMFACFAYAGDGSEPIQHSRIGAGIAVPPPVVCPTWQAESVHLYSATADLIQGLAAHTSQRRHFSDAACQFGSDLDPRGNRQGHVITDPTLEFKLSSQTWEEMAGTAFALRRQATTGRFSESVHSGERGGLESIQPFLFMGSGDVLHPQEYENEDEEAYTLLCEWIDEYGACNMDVLGDRAWMRDHLYRHHRVAGNDKSQHACLWRGCTDRMSKGSLARHVVSCHLRAGASCGFCSKVYSRADVARRHTKKCKVANGESVPRDRTKMER